VFCREKKSPNFGFNFWQTLKCGWILGLVGFFMMMMVVVVVMVEIREN
jgi:hypothetical protein